MMRGYATTAMGQVHYRSAGAGATTVVLLHESPLSSATYESVLDQLPPRLRGVAFDTPGYGASDPWPGESTEIPDLARMLLAALDELAIHRFAVVGTHTGAALAVSMAAQAPDRVSHAMLSGVPLLSEEERRQYLASWAPPVAVELDGSHLRWAWERYERLWKGPPELLHLGATTLLANLDRYHVGYNAAFRYDPAPDLRNLACPVLLYTAEEDLLIASDRSAAAELSHIQLDTVPDLQGQLPLRRPRAFGERLARWVLEGV